MRTKLIKKILRDCWF